jgi:hypothetical protein
MPGAVTGKTRRDNLAPLGNKSLQPLYILIVDVIYFFFTEPAYFFSQVEKPR